MVFDGPFLEGVFTAAETLDLLEARHRLFGGGSVLWPGEEARGYFRAGLVPNFFPRVRRLSLGIAEVASEQLQALLGLIVLPERGVNEIVFRGSRLLRCLVRREAGVTVHGAFFGLAWSLNGVGGLSS